LYWTGILQESPPLTETLHYDWRPFLFQKVYLSSVKDEAEVMSDDEQGGG
jgi:hypothetical protein